MLLPLVDLRSDTVTRPTEGMWNAMHHAPVGDDVFGEDPGLLALEEKVAELFGKEAGVFVPSGTMSNQLGIKIHTQPADEVLLDESAHIFHAEGAAPGLISGVQLHPLRGMRGLLTADLIGAAVREGNDWEPRTALIALENTANLGGGTCYPLQTLELIRELSQRLHLPVHIDGARIWNASVASGISLRTYGSLCDTISVCFSKGLGAPVGSMLLGSKSQIKKARRFRKILGGGMRQAGMLAAAASYAIDHHFPLLHKDHQRARQFAQVVSETSGFYVNTERIETNIVIFSVLEGSVQDALEHFLTYDIAMIPFGGNTIRATFHHQITDEHLDRILDAVPRFRA